MKVKRESNETGGLSPKVSLKNFVGFLANLQIMVNFVASL